MSQPSRDPVLVQCNDCGGMTESAHDYARISFLKTRTWRCPDCYQDWRMSDTKQRGHWVTCQVPRCDAPRLHGDTVREVCDPVTRVVAFVCPDHFDQVQAARLHHGQRVDAQRANDITAAVTDALKASAPRTLVTPGNPDGIKHIAATLAVVAPDLDDAEVAAVAESFYDMAQPVFRIPAFTDPGDADPKALDHTCDTNPVKFCVACMQGIHAVDYLDLMRAHHRRSAVLDPGKTDGLKAGDLIFADNFNKADSATLAGIHPSYSDTYIRRMRLDQDSPLIPPLGDAYDPITGEVDYTSLRPHP